VVEKQHSENEKQTKRSSRSLGSKGKRLFTKRKQERKRKLYYQPYPENLG